MDVDKIKSADANSPSIRDQDNGPLASRSSSDVEKASSSIQAGETVQLQRKLQSRHLQMIAIGIISPSSSWRFPGTFEIEREREREIYSILTHILSLGGTIGTGLFIGSGGALATAGPAGSLIAYAFVGTIVYSVMVALGEMATYIPVSGAFTVYAARFVDPSLGFAMGWIYW